jgi:hypothetical protein
VETDEAGLRVQAGIQVPELGVGRCFCDKASAFSREAWGGGNGEGRGWFGNNKYTVVAKSREVTLHRIELERMMKILQVDRNSEKANAK